MQVFKIKVTEKLSRTVSIESISEGHAIQKARELYNDADIVLGIDYDDLVETEFEGVTDE